MRQCRHIGGMIDNPERLNPYQRLNKQFRETTPGGRLFLLAWYTAAGIGLYYLAVWWAEFGKPFDKWLASFFS